MQRVIGVDICGVLSPRRIFFEDYYMDVKPEPGIIWRLKRLLKRYQAKLIIITVEQSERLRGRRLEWLKAYVFRELGLTEDDVFFCKRREEKRDICQQQNVTILVDDRLQIAECVQGVSSLKRTIVFRPKEDPKQFKEILKDVKVKVARTLNELFWALNELFRPTSSAALA